MNARLYTHTRTHVCTGVYLRHKQKSKEVEGERGSRAHYLRVKSYVRVCELCLEQKEQREGNKTPKKTHTQQQQQRQEIWPVGRKRKRRRAFINITDTETSTQTDSLLPTYKRQQRKSDKQSKQAGEETKRKSRRHSRLCARFAEGLKCV